MILEINEKNKKNIKKIKKEITDLSTLMDNLEINIIEKNIKNTKIIELYKLMMENIILEHHNVCKNIFN